MTEPAAPEVPVDRQLGDAQAAVLHATAMLTEARRAELAASRAYEHARRCDPAGQITDDARRAWAEALHDWVDATIDQAQKRDELRALHRQTATYAVLEEGAGRG